MSNIKKLSFFCIGVVTVVLMLEGLLRLLPVSNGFAFLPVNNENTILRGTPERNFTFSKGWNFRLAVSSRLNNYGFISDHDYMALENHSVAIIGDSYIQAAALRPEESIQNILHKHLSPCASVYGFGQAGGKLSDYLGMAGWIKDTFHPEAAVILLTEKCVSDSTNPKQGGYHFMRDGTHVSLARTDFYPKRWVQVISKLGLFRYLFDNLLILDNVRKMLSPQKGPEAGQVASLQNLDPIMQYFLDNLPHAIGVSKKDIVFLIDADRKALYKGLPPSVRDIDLIADKAEAQGYSIIRLNATFAKEYGWSHRRLDFSPIDGHWNSRAHKIAADQLKPVLSAKFGGEREESHTASFDRNSPSLVH